MLKIWAVFFCFIFFFISGSLNAKLVIRASNGNEIVYSDEKVGSNTDPHAWSKIYFVNRGQKYDLSRGDRYYTENGSSKVSPSGKYLKIISISGGYVTLEDGTETYTDRAYCSVVDMDNGCIVSDWDGEACSYNWAEDKDVLSEYPDGSGEKFDFLSLRPKMKISHNPLSTYSLFDINNLLRCDAPGQRNINEYQRLINKNPNAKNPVSSAVKKYLNSLKASLVISGNTPLYASPDSNAKTKAYLIADDRVKVIQFSKDSNWINIGYINSKGMPLITWIKRD